MSNYTLDVFEYHFEKDGKETVERISLVAIELGYIKQKDLDGYKVTARYFIPQPQRWD